MANKTYSEKLKSPKWQKIRLKILERDQFTCMSCFDKESTLHVHHKHYIFGNEIWDYTEDNFITLCENCHKEVTEIKKSIKLTIDNDFVCNDVLYELNGILSIIKSFNPYDLQLIKKSCEKHYKMLLKKYSKHG